MRGADVLAVWDEAIRRTEAAMPTPLGNHGESAMHSAHHAGLVWDMRQARAAVADLLAENARLQADVARLQEAELLEALRRMASAFAPHPREDTEGWREEHEACDLARAAIAKATGATP